MSAPTPDDFRADIPSDVAERAYYGVSHLPERRAQNTRNDYAATLAGDYETLRSHALKGGTMASLDAEFSRYRDGYRRRYLAYLHSSARCVSWFIAGPSGFPAARMNKRADIAHRRLSDIVDFRGRTLAAIKRALRADLRAIYAGDGDALERLESRISAAESLQARMRETNAAIRRTKKAGPQAQFAALLAMGYQEMTAHRLLTPDFAGRVGFPDFELTNNGANIRRMRARVEQISRMQAAPSRDVSGTVARVEDAPADNRVRLFFPGKPDESTRAQLKANGFRWTPTLGCWQAYFSESARHLARAIAGVKESEVPAA